LSGGTVYRFNVAGVPDRDRGSLICPGRPVSPHARGVRHASCPPASIREASCVWRVRGIPAWAAVLPEIRDGDLETAITIRTLVLKDGVAHIQAGSSPA